MQNLSLFSGATQHLFDGAARLDLKHCDVLSICLLRGELNQINSVSRITDLPMRLVVISRTPEGSGQTVNKPKPHQDFQLYKSVELYSDVKKASRQ